MPNNAPAYIRVLSLLHAIRELSPFNSLTAGEELLLDDLILRWHESASVKMSDVLKDDEQSSRTTAHRRLVALRDKGLINFEDDPEDKRAKLVTPGQKADAYVKLFRKGVDQLILEERFK